MISSSSNRCLFFEYNSGISFLIISYVIVNFKMNLAPGWVELFESDRYRNYLTTMSRFHKYSLNTVMLIHAQRPDATLVAGFSKWKNSFGRHVKKGEKGIQILAPTPYKIKVDKEKLDPDTKLPMLDDEGKPITEEKEVTIPMFKVVSVFDVAQTEGKPLPQISFSLTGDVAQYEVFMEALRRTSQVPITIKPMEPGMDGYFHLEKQAIFLREGMSQVQTVCAAIHGKPSLCREKKTGILRKWKRKAFPTPSVSISALKPPTTASVISLPGPKARS